MPVEPKYSVLCFGDSNTWGFIPGTGARFGVHTRWPGVMQQELGPDYRIIEEAFNGRTTVREDPLVAGRNAQPYLLPCLGSHKPLDLVIVFIGLNDLKNQFNVTCEEIARGAATLLNIVKTSDTGVGGAAPPVLLMSPPRVGKVTQYAEQFGGTQEKSAQLGPCMRARAKEAGCEFIDTADLVVTSDDDGIHLSAESHRTLGEAVAKKVRQMLG